MRDIKQRASVARDGLFLFVILIGALIVSSCTGSLSTKGRSLVEKGQYVEAIETYDREISKNPNKKDTWRDLAFAYYKKGDYDNAIDAINKADQTDPSTHLCRGLIFEAKGDNNKAIQSFSEALNYNPTPNTKAQLRSHLDALIRESLQAEIASAVSQEGSLGATDIPDNTIAVVKFDGTLLPKEISPIATGIGEFTMVDLSKVESLRLVERLKVELLLKELEIASSDAVDAAQAPRVGLLLGSKSVVTGKLIGAGAQRFRLDGALVNTPDATSKITEPGESGLVLDEILAVQKAMVYDILEYLGVQPSDADRDSINAKPTESLEAFLAYSRGLEFMMMGLYEDAIEEFKLAVQADGGFDLASDQLVDAQTAFTNQQNGPATPGQLENSFFSDISNQGIDNGRMLTTFIDDTDILDPSNNNPTNTPTKPPVIGARNAGANVTGNIDGD
ncbi:MAG: tetratricopeptide repeat protein [Candidatus Zixiibacteriota bacterium]